MYAISSILQSIFMAPPSCLLTHIGSLTCILIYKSLFLMNSFDKTFFRFIVIYTITKASPRRFVYSFISWNV